MIGIVPAMKWEAMYRNCIRVFLLAWITLPLCGCGEDSPSEPPPAMTEYDVSSASYQNNRFFRLDLAPPGSPLTQDVPGRDASLERIALDSIHVFKLLPPLAEFEPGDVANIAAYLDTTGVFWTASGCPPNDFGTPAEYGAHWRELTFRPLLDNMGELQAIDLGAEMADYDVLAVSYAVVDRDGSHLFDVGDNFAGPPGAEIPGEDETFYRLKLLKAFPWGGARIFHYAYAFQYTLRNIYSLGRTNIDPDSFRLTIARADATRQADVDESGIPYIRLFGLDRYDVQGSPSPDGVVDFGDAYLIDLHEGLLRFPMEEPFNAGEATYAGYAVSPSFWWEGTYLERNQAPDLYYWYTRPTDYLQYGRFRLKAVYRAEDGE